MYGILLERYVAVGLTHKSNVNIFIVSMLSVCPFRDGFCLSVGRAAAAAEPTSNGQAQNWDSDIWEAKWPQLL